MDALLKKEFDAYRAEGRPHPLMSGAGLNAVPHAHPQLDAWRANFKGVRSVHEASGFELFGAIDDLWRDLPAFDAKLEFTIKLIPYEGDDGWVERTLGNIHKALNAPQPPAASSGCTYCEFAEASTRVGSE